MSRDDQYSKLDTAGGNIMSRVGQYSRRATSLYRKHRLGTRRVRLLAAVSFFIGAGAAAINVNSGLADVVEETIFFQYYVTEEGQTKAAWRPGATVNTIEEDGLAPVEILVPREHVDIIRGTFENPDTQSPRLVEYVIVLRGSVSTSYCHYKPTGGTHCHTIGTPY